MRARGEHDDRHRRPVAHAADDFEPVAVGQAQVDDQQVGLVTARLDLRRARPVSASIDPVVLGLEQHAQHVPDSGLVLDDEDADASHGRHARGSVDRQRELEARRRPPARVAPRSCRRAHGRSRGRSRVRGPTPDDRRPRARRAGICRTGRAGSPGRQARSVVVDRHPHERPVGSPRRSRRACRAACTWPRCRADWRTRCTMSGRIDVAPAAARRAIRTSTGYAASRPSYWLRARRRRDRRAYCQSRSQRDLAGLEAHEIEHVGDELGHLPRLRLDRAARATTRVASSSARATRRRACCRRRPSRPAACADRARSTRAAYCASSPLRPRRARLGGLRQPRALQCERDLARRTSRADGAARAAALDGGFAGSTASTPSAARAASSGR